MKTSLKWPTQMTAGFVEQLIRAEKDVRKAMLVFDSASAEYCNGFRHDHTTFGVMIAKLVSANQFQLAEQFLDRMKQENCNACEDIFLSLCRGYGRVHRPLESVRVFHKMIDFNCKPSEKSYVTVFSILVEENHLKLAVRFYKYMREMGVSPSLVSLNVLIKALCKSGETMDAAIKIFREMPSRGFCPDTYTYGTLINGLCKSGNLNEAKTLLGEMESRGCSPSVISYSSLINGLCKAKCMDEAMELVEDMVKKGIEPNIITFTSLIDGFCKVGNSLQALQMMEMMNKKRIKANYITYSSLIDGLCREKRISEAVDIFDRMKVQGLKPDAGMYGKIIDEFCEVGKFQEAANFVDEMVLDGIQLSRVTWSVHARTNNRVVQGLCCSGNPTRAYQVYLSMRTRGISIDSATFSTLVHYFCRKGDILKAVLVVTEMISSGCVPERQEWQVLLDSLWKRRKGLEECEKILLEVVVDASSS